MQKQTLLSKQDIEKLTEWSDGYFYKIFYYLEDFIQDGIEKNLFTKEEAQQDLDIALWYAYAGNNIGIYEYYYKVIKWMPYSEENAKNSGAWHYRYAVALMYCGELEKAYEYAKKGVQAEESYPWGWLVLAQLQAHFGEQKQALASIDKGLDLVPNDYEFLNLKDEVLENKSLERMLCHYISPENDMKLQEDIIKTNYNNDSDTKEKLQSIQGVKCDIDSLNKIKSIWENGIWQDEGPYYSCLIQFIDDKKIAHKIKFVFEMNKAMLSKISVAQLRNLYQNVINKLLYEQKYGMQYELQSVIVNRDSKIKLVYYNEKEQASLLRYKTLQTIRRNIEEKVEDIALTLYRKDTDKNLQYVECWLDNNKIVKHYGFVGEEGEYKVYNDCTLDDYKMYLDIFVGRYERLGFVSWKSCVKKPVLIKILASNNQKNIFNHDDLIWVNFSYEVLQKALEVNVTGFLNDWGYHKNADGMYEVDFYCDVVDTKIATKLIKRAIKPFNEEKSLIIQGIIELDIKTDEN